jgi:hypothetical protein
MKDQRSMYIRIDHVSVSNYDGGEGPVLKTKGCSCCVKEIPLTPASLCLAITDATRYLGELKNLAREIDWTDVVAQRGEYND